MSFKSNVSAPNFEQMALQKLQLALQMRAQKQRDEAFKEKTRIDKIKAISQAQKDQLDMEAKRLEIRSKSIDNDSALTKREQNIGPLLSAANDPQGSITDRQTAANQSIRQINQAMMARSPDGIIRPGVPEFVGGNAGSAVSVSRTNERNEIQNAVKTELAKSGAEVRGELAAGNIIIDTERALKRQIATTRKQGGDTSLLEERLDFAKQLRSARGNKGQIKVMNPPSPNLIRDVQQSYSASSLAVDVLQRIQNDVKTGKIKLGVGGSVQFGLETVTEWMGDLAASAIIEGERADEFQQLVESARNSGSNGVTFRGSDGAQLTLGLDAMALAWQFVKSWKQSARITLLEFETALRELRLTGLNLPEVRVRSALEKVSRATLQSQKSDKSFLDAFAPGVSGQILDQSLTSEEDDFLKGWKKPGSSRTSNSSSQNTSETSVQPQRSEETGSYLPGSREHLDRILMGGGVDPLKQGAGE